MSSTRVRSNSFSSGQVRNGNSDTPASPSSRTSSKGENIAGHVRPGSGSSGRNGKNSNSMVRLTDEPLVHGSSSSSALSPQARPGSGSSQTRQRAGMARLPDDAPMLGGGSQTAVVGSSSSSSRPGSAASIGQSGLAARKPSLTRLPADESCAAQALPQRPSTGDASRSNLSSPSQVTNPTRQTAMRDRLKQDLSVSTAPIATPQRKKEAFRLLKEETIQDLYEFDQEIYSGGAKGKVVAARGKINNEEVIVKIRTKRPNKGGERSWRAIMNQFLAMRGSSHVLDINEILEDDTAFYVIMPKCNGGELFDFLVTETEVPETECKRIIREILTAVGHLHKSGLVHRDIKPENIMFDLDITQKTPKSVKLIDFDTCVEWTPASPKSTKFVGTPGYIAPEALLGEVTPQSDLWSIGVILYILMTGETPWSSLVSLEDGTVGSPGATRMYNALKSEVLEWDKDPWPDFPLACELCQRLMAFNAEERPLSVQDALNHEWLRDEGESDAA